MAILNQAQMMMPGNLGILDQERQQQMQKQMQQQALLDQMQQQDRHMGINPQNMTRKKATDITANTGNARNSMAAYPDHKIGVNEMLMRTGGAVMGGAQQGGLQAYSDGLAQYGAIQDYNREAGYNLYQDQLARDAASSKFANEQAASDEENKDMGFEAAAKLKRVEDALSGLNERSGVTGLGRFIARPWDLLMGDEREELRLLIQSVKVDRTLARTALTKGAISDKEMAIFMSDQPSWNANWKIWRSWFERYQEALKVLYKNTQGKEYVSEGSTAYTGEDSSDDNEINNLIEQANK